MCLVETPMTYYATMELTEKNQAYEKLTSDAKKMWGFRAQVRDVILEKSRATYTQRIVATSAFGLGIDR